MYVIFTVRGSAGLADRQPLWGWRDDTLEIMERQIDPAADHGIAFLAFRWYWHDDQKDIRADPKHAGLEAFLKARAPLGRRLPHVPHCPASPASPLRHRDPPVPVNAP